MDPDLESTDTRVASLTFACQPEWANEWSRVLLINERCLGVNFVDEGRECGGNVYFHLSTTKKGSNWADT